jgi:hypothetical protein
MIVFKRSYIDPDTDPDVWVADDVGVFIVTNFSFAMSPLR